jgi:molybdopterin molybdotransferase
MRRHGLDEVLVPLLEGLAPVEPARLPLAEAIGHVLAEALTASGPVPAKAIALRAGLPVRALDLVGASPHSPAVLDGMAAMVAVGSALPPGCDAILDPAAADNHGHHVEITESVAPGQGVRFAGHDLPPGGQIAPEGAILTPIIALAAEAAGIWTVAIRSATVCLAMADESHTLWLRHWLVTLGCSLVPAGTPAAITLKAAQLDLPRLSLNPGETGWAAREPAGLVIDLPCRFDGTVSILLALVLPLLARLQGQHPRLISRPLRRKLVSMIGAAELAMLADTGDSFEVVACGDITLGALAAADAFLVVPAGLEGYPSGTVVAACPLTVPLSAPTSPR